MTRHLEPLVLAAVIATLVSGAAVAQNVSEWSSESRTILAFKVNPDALKKLLPAGWESAPVAAGPAAGANLNLTMMERAVVLDGQGKPLRTGTSRYVVLGAPARNSQTGQTNTIIVSGISAEGAGAYGVYSTASTAKLERTVAGDAEQPARVTETWQFIAASGERIDLHVAYRRGPVSRAHADTVVRSAIKPEFQRTYHIDQAVDVVRGSGVADRVEQLAFKAGGPKLAPLFDGTETLVSVSAVPFYVREITIP